MGQKWGHSSFRCNNHSQPGALMARGLLQQNEECPHSGNTHFPLSQPETALGRRTPLYDLHVGLGARMVDFGGWDMPVNYGSQIEEHHAVRRDAGVFDVSHM